MIHGMCGGVVTICSKFGNSFKRLWTCGQRLSIDYNWWRIYCTSTRRRFVRFFMKALEGERSYFLCADRIQEIYIWPHNTHVKYPLFLHFKQQQNAWKNIRKNSKMTFHEYPLGGSRVVLFGRIDRQTDEDMTLCKDAWYAFQPRFTRSLLTERNQILLVRLLEWSYWEEAGVGIKLQMVFESIWWSTWLTGFQITGFLQPSQRNKIYMYNSLIFVREVHYNLHIDYILLPCNCMIKRQMNLTNYKIQSQINTHIIVGVIEIVEVGFSSSSTNANNNNNKNSFTFH